MFSHNTLIALSNKGFRINADSTECVYRFKSIEGHLIYQLDSNKNIHDIDVYIRKDRYNVYQGTVYFKPNNRPAFLDADWQRDMFNCIHETVRQEGQAGIVLKKLWELGDEFKAVQNCLDKQF